MVTSVFAGAATFKMAWDRMSEDFGLRARVLGGLG